MEGWVARSATGFVAAARVRELSRKSDFRGGLQAAGHLGAVAASSAGLAIVAPAAPWTWPVLFVIQGVLINCLYAGQHELSHWTVFRARAANDALGHPFGFVTLNPFLTDRWLHFAHHRATHDLERDPELMGAGDYTLAGWALDLSGAAFWVRRVAAIARAAAGRGLGDAWWLDARQRRVVVLEARIHMALWAAIGLVSWAAHSAAALTFWLAPMLVTKWAHQLQNIGEHSGRPHAADILVNTRTLAAPAPFRALVWNMGYHTAHHCYPGVPFHALPALDAEIRSVRPVPTFGHFAAQREIIAGLLPGRRRAA